MCEILGTNTNLNLNPSLTEFHYIWRSTISLNRCDDSLKFQLSYFSGQGGRSEVRGVDQGKAAGSAGSVGLLPAEARRQGPLSRYRRFGHVLRRSQVRSGSQQGRTALGSRWAHCFKYLSRMKLYNKIRQGSIERWEIRRISFSIIFALKNYFRMARENTECVTASLLIWNAVVIAF